MPEPRRYVIWGSAGHAKVLNEAICRLGGEVVALFDNNVKAVSAIPGVPLIGGMEAFHQWVKAVKETEQYYGLIAIGGDRGQDRLQLQKLFFDNGIQIEPLIHPNAFVASNVTIGPGTQILAMATVAADVTLGSACIINHKASIDHECQIGDGVHVAPGATLCGCIVVEENALIGAGSVVLPRIRIGRSSIVGAGAVVTKDVPDNAIVVGNPARVLRYR